MQLTKVTDNGKLRYFCQGMANISIMENKHYRWICFNDVMQSLMLKRQPEKLTLPHQTAALLPLLFFKPVDIVELGLGGGNIARFLSTLSPNIELTSVEYDNQVISCFHNHFNPQNNELTIKHQDANTWLQENAEPYDWLICDIYQQQVTEFQETLSRFTLLLSTISPQGCLTINLPDASDQEINLCLTILAQLQQHHQIVYFHIPNYLNVIIHVVPNSWQIESLLPSHKRSYLNKVKYRRWRKLWQNKHTL